jgi:hypothetical protein
MQQVIQTLVNILQLELSVEASIFNKNKMKISLILAIFAISLSSCNDYLNDNITPDSALAEKLPQGLYCQSSSTNI